MSKKKTHKFQFLGRHQRACNGKFTFLDRHRGCTSPFTFMFMRRRIREGVRKW